MPGVAMQAMVLQKQGEALKLMEIDDPEPGPSQVLLKVAACGVCRTDLHVVDGDLPDPKLPLVPGHQIVGTVIGKGENVTGFSEGDRIGVPWLGGCCGKCEFCRAGKENLCDNATYTGYRVNGGFAEKCTADVNFCFPIPVNYPDIEAAPLLCAGLIGYRAFRMTGEAKKILLAGFGSAAYILTQVALYLDREIYAWTRPGDSEGQEFARKMGVAWAGGSDEPPPDLVDAVIIFAPVGPLVPLALKAVKKGGIVVCAGIHMSDIPSFPYSMLWEERSVKSVANLTRKDGEDFFSIAPEVPVKTEIQTYSLSRTGRALDDLRAGRISGSAVIRISEDA